MRPLTVELIPDHDFGGFTARVPDIPAYGEGATEDEAIADLKEALMAYVEAFGLADLRASPRNQVPKMGTLRAILRDVEIGADEFIRLWRRL